MQFSDAFIDQVRNSVSIVGLVNSYVRLKKSGKDHSGLCPFHQEKTPSFMVSEGKQIFKCFGCGEGGDVFKFIMLIENVSFPEAIQYLAERQGIAMPRANQTDMKDQKRPRFLKIMEMATRFFQQCLEEKREAFDYLRQRQISDETTRQFCIGYAPPGRRLLDELQRHDFTVEETIACGLVREADPARHYDKFRSRIMFPIRDLSERTIAFGGRILGDGVPKYLNSPDTILYKKSRNLYPLSVTRDEIRRRDFAILVEGYFDCILPFQFGIRNIVASLGTSLTEDQVKLVGRYTRNVVVNYDPDSAGTAAAMRSIDLFLAQGFRVNILQLPQETDPDTFVRNEGSDVYLERVKSSQPYLEFALSQFIDGQRDPSGPKGKQEIVTQILPYLTKIPNKVERAEYVSRIAARLQVDESLILLEMRKMSRRTDMAPELRFPRLIDQLTPAESALLTAVLDEEWTALTLKELEPVLFEGLRTEQIFQKVLHLNQQKKELDVIALRDLVTEEGDRNLLESLALSSSNFPLSEEVIRNSVLALRKKQYERLSRQIQGEIKAEEEQDSKSSRIDELLLEKEKIRKRIRDLESGSLVKQRL